MEEEEIFAAGETKQRTEPRHMHLPCRLATRLALSRATKSLHFPASVRGYLVARDLDENRNSRPLIRRLPRGFFFIRVHATIDLVCASMTILRSRGVNPYRYTGGTHSLK